jgi:hypothetical protein
VIALAMVFAGVLGTFAHAVLHVGTTLISVASEAGTGRSGSLRDDAVIAVTQGGPGWWDTALGAVSFFALVAQFAALFATWLSTGPSGGPISFFETPYDFGRWGAERIGRSMTVAFWWFVSGAWAGWSERFPLLALTSLLKWGAFLVVIITDALIYSAVPFVDLRPLVVSALEVFLNPAQSDRLGLSFTLSAAALSALLFLAGRALRRHRVR